MHTHKRTFLYTPFIFVYIVNYNLSLFRYHSLKRLYKYSSIFPFEILFLFLNLPIIIFLFLHHFISHQSTSQTLLQL